VLDFIDIDGGNNSLSGGTVSAPLELSRRYLTGNAIGQVLAQETAGNGSEENVLWMLADQVGSNRDLAQYDTMGDTTSVVTHYTIDSYGNPTAVIGSLADTRYIWAQTQYDAIANQHYAMARWYDPRTGSWESEDPKGFDAGDANLGRYVGNQPTYATDPTGLESPTFSGRRNRGQPTGFWDSLSSSWHGMQATYTSLILEYAMNRPDLARGFMEEAYECGPLGQTRNPTGGPVERAVYYYGTRGALTVSTIAVSLAGGVMVVEVATGSTMSITIVSNGGRTVMPHFGWQVGGQWYHATGWGNGFFQSFVWGDAQRMGAGGFWNTITRIPILNPSEATGFTGYTANCLTGVGRALANGWTRSLVGITIVTTEVEGAENNAGGPEVLPPRSSGGGGGYRPNGPNFIP